MDKPKDSKIKQLFTEKENVNNKNNNNRKKQQKETTETNTRTVSIDRGTARDSYNTLPSFARVSSPWSPEFNSIDVPSCQFNLAFFRFLGQEDGATVPPPSPSFEPDRTLQGFHGRVPFRGVVGEQEFCALGGVLVLWHVLNLIAMATLANRMLPNHKQNRSVWQVEQA